MTTRKASTLVAALIVLSGHAVRAGSAAAGRAVQAADHPRPRGTPPWTTTSDAARSSFASGPTS